jgi:hypothetical protein
MSNAFPRAWARGLTVVGGIVVFVGVVAAIAVMLFAPAFLLDPFGGAAIRQILGLPPAGPAESMLLRVFAGATLLVGALALGAPMLVGGQLVLVVLEQRDLLRRERLLLVQILRKLPEAQAAPPPPPAADERLRWRR